MTKMTTFNPYQEASEDLKMRHAASRRYWKRMCWTCGLEKPLEGGKVRRLGSLGTFSKVQPFKCADCLAKKNPAEREPGGAK